MNVFHFYVVYQEANKKTTTRLYEIFQDKSEERLGSVEFK